MDEKVANGGWTGPTVLAFVILLVAGIYFKVENQKLESDIKEKEMKIEELKKIERKYERDLDGCINEKTCSEKAKKLQEEKNEWVELLFTILIISIVFNRQQTVPFILRIFFLILSPNTLHNTQTNTARNTANQS